MVLKAPAVSYGSIKFSIFLSPNYYSAEQIMSYSITFYNQDNIGFKCS